ncbi:MAG: ABC transporter substrate-binding protein [bacterium]
MKKSVLSLVLLVAVLVLAIGYVGFSDVRQYNLISPMGKYNEAPMLGKLVEEGKLPPVEKRLPKNPVVVEPYEEIGQYGGDWRSVWRNMADRWGVANHMLYVRLVRMRGDLKGFEPDVADRWEVSRDAKVYTFHIREGVRWSDGQPLTADDVMFWYEDILQNKDLTPSFPKVFTAGGKPMRIERVDDYTFRVIFEGPYGLFLLRQAIGGWSWDFIGYPKHYLKQFHPNYVDKGKLDEMAKKEGFEAWHQLFGQKYDWLYNPDLPMLTAWRVKSAPSPVGRFIWERNPYFYKVDPKGNQLPYIDRVIWEMIGDSQVALMRAMAGEVDMNIRYFRRGDYTLLMQNREAGDYRVNLYYEARGGDDYTTFLINQNVKDPVLRDLFRNKKFRQALSLALNREEVNELVYLGLAKPRQASLDSTDPFYDPEWERAYAEYDPDRANKMLDEMGLTGRDKDGFRLRPDGKTLEVVLEFAGGEELPDPIELAKEYWERIGIKVNVKADERSLYQVRAQAGEIEIGSWSFSASLANADSLLGIGYGAAWAPLWTLWYTSGGKSGEEPPPEVKRIFELWDRITVTPDDEERNRLFKEIINIHKENLWVIGMVGEAPRSGVIKNNFRNVKENAPYGGIVPTPGCTSYPEQFFIKTMKREGKFSSPPLNLMVGGTYGNK